jgi:hypothetical protein
MLQCSAFLIAYINSEHQLFFCIELANKFYINRTDDILTPPLLLGLEWNLSGVLENLLICSAAEMNFSVFCVGSSCLRFLSKLNG